MRTQQRLLNDKADLSLTKRSVTTLSSGTTSDITDIPSWVRKITVILNQVSLSSADELAIQIGDSGGIENSAYTGGAGQNPGFVAANTYWPITISYTSNSDVVSGIITLVNPQSDVWIMSGVVADNVQNATHSAGRKSLSDTLTQIRLLGTGAGTFDNGTWTVFYE